MKSKLPKGTAILKGQPGNPTPDIIDSSLAPLLAKEPRACEEFVAAHGPRLLSAARRVLGQEEDARDCVQETFSKAFAGLHGFEGRSSLGTWLYRILLNQCLMKLRTRNRQNEVALDPLMPEFDSQNCRVEASWQIPKDVETLIDSKHVRDQVRAAIISLPDAARDVLLLRDIEEFSTRETAETLEITEGAVKVRLHRARAALKKLLEPVYGSNGATAKGEPS